MSTEEKEEVALLAEVFNMTESPAFSPMLDTLFSQESMSTIMAKTAALEALLHLSARNCKFNEFIRNILMIVMKVVNCEAGSILEVNPTDQSLFFRAVVGHKSDKVADFVLPPGKGIAGQAVSTIKSVVVHNVPENEKHLKAMEAAIGFTAKNIVAIPILVRARVYGVIELLNRNGEATFTAKDVELLEYLCQMAGRSIEIRLMIAWAKKQG